MQSSQQHHPRTSSCWSGKSRARFHRLPLRERQYTNNNSLCVRSQSLAGPRCSQADMCRDGIMQGAPTPRGITVRGAARPFTSKIQIRVVPQCMQLQTCLYGSTCSHIVLVHWIWKLELLIGRGSPRTYAYSHRVRGNFRLRPGALLLLSCLPLH